MDRCPGNPRGRNGHQARPGCRGDAISLRDARRGVHCTSHGRSGYQADAGQWPELGVHIKDGKKATTFLSQIPELVDVAFEWDRMALSKLPAKAPWYVPIDQHWGLQALSKESPGANRGLAFDKRLRLLFARAGLPYRSAHKFRQGLRHPWSPAHRDDAGTTPSSGEGMNRINVLLP
jgi:hypothetical protein